LSMGLTLTVAFTEYEGAGIVKKPGPKGPALGYPGKGLTTQSR
jgi:hypothetical protein